MSKQKPKFKRTDAVKYSKLGVRRKKLQKYRKPRGRDNKLRLNMKGHTRKVKIGFRTAKKTRGEINQKQPILIHNLNELKNIQKNQIAIVAKIGIRKKIEIAKYAKEKNIEVNFNPEKFIKKTEEYLKKAKEEKQTKEKKKQLEEKKAKKKEKDEKKEDMENKTEEVKTETKSNGEVK